MDYKNKMKLYYNNRGKLVGEMIGGIYRSHRQSSKHLLRILDAWGIDKKILDQLKKDDCLEVRILDHDDMIVYRAPISVFDEHGVEKNFVGRQVFLPRKWWIKKELS